MRANITSGGVNLFVYFNADSSGMAAIIYCDKTDVCTVNCMGLNSCSNTQIVCDTAANCIINCDANIVNKCPVVSTYSTSQAPSSYTSIPLLSPSQAPSSYTINPSVYPSLFPSQAPSFEPTLEPISSSFAPSVAPSSFSTHPPTRNPSVASIYSSFQSSLYPTSSPLLFSSSNTLPVPWKPRSTSSTVITTVVICSSFVIIAVIVMILRRTDWIKTFLNKYTNRDVRVMNTIHASNANDDGQNSCKESTDDNETSQKSVNNTDDAKEADEITANKLNIEKDENITSGALLSFSLSKGAWSEPVYFLTTLYRISSACSTDSSSSFKRFQDHLSFIDIECNEHAPFLANNTLNRHSTKTHQAPSFCALSAFLSFIPILLIASMVNKKFLLLFFTSLCIGSTYASSSAHIAAGYSHNCILRNNGIKCWGLNENGQLGYEDSVNRGDTSDTMGDQLLLIDLGPNFKPMQVSVGLKHSCALSTNKKIKCWGRGGKLGYGDSADRGNDTGTMGSNLPDVDLGDFVPVKVVTGGLHNCALSAAGALKCWGSNTWGQLGYQDTNNRGDEPGEMGSDLVEVNVGFNISDIALGRYHACALSTSKTVKCWGLSTHGALGNSNASDVLAAVLNDNLPFVELGATFLPTAIVAGQQFSCALSTTNKVKCWGRNANGQLADGTYKNKGDESGEMGDQLSEIDFPTDFIPMQIATGRQHACALSTHNTVKCWGHGGSGRLGYGDYVTRNYVDAQDVDLGPGFIPVQIAPGQYHTCVLSRHDEFKCFGDNTQGQLGYEDTVNRGDQAGEMGINLSRVNVGSFPTSNPSPAPSSSPTDAPSSLSTPPTRSPTRSPSESPTASTLGPTYDPTVDPTVDPTNEPTTEPTVEPTFIPTVNPTQEPTYIPTEPPTHDPTYDPTSDPTADPTYDPTNDPTTDPTMEPTSDPTYDPTLDPTIDPTADPTYDTTVDPTTPAPKTLPSIRPSSTVITTVVICSSFVIIAVIVMILRRTDWIKTFLNKYMNRDARVMNTIHASNANDDGQNSCKESTDDNETSQKSVNNTDDAKEADEITVNKLNIEKDENIIEGLPEPLIVSVHDANEPGAQANEEKKGNDDDSDSDNIYSDYKPPSEKIAAAVELQPATKNYYDDYHAKLWNKTDLNQWDTSSIGTEGQTDAEYKWIKATLERCDAEEWIKYFEHFKREKMNDLRLNLIEDKDDKTWEILLPALGVRMQFKHLWKQKYHK